MLKSRRDFSGKLVEKPAVILTYFKGFEGNLTKKTSEMSAQFAERDLFSGSLDIAFLTADSAQTVSSSDPFGNLYRSRCYWSEYLRN